MLRLTTYSTPCEATGVVYTESRRSRVASSFILGPCFSTTTSLELQNRDYNTALREDDFLLFKLQADYEFRRWLTLGASYRYRENDSNQDISDYKQNVFLLEATATL